jgi:thiamine biosynthesis protein ThiI
MRLISLISSGIDSPVATYLLSRKADEIILIHADGRPFTDDREIDNFILIAKYLKEIIQCNIKTYIIPHGKNLYYYIQNCDEKYTCIFCKRMLLRYAAEISNLEEADAIVMGDSLGQVASQTLHNISVIEKSINIPILRPLIGLDKEDIVEIAKDIGTYDLTILPSDSCRAVPKKPATKAKLETILKFEENINLSELINQAMNDIEILYI